MGCVKSGNDREVSWREGNGEDGLLRGGEDKYVEKRRKSVCVCSVYILFIG